MIITNLIVWKQVMWRIFEAKPRTRLGRLSHARTHDDILDLVGDDGDDIYIMMKCLVCL